MGENLGQHFLTNESVAEDIVSAGRISQQDSVLEIGPGKGILTKKLIQQAGQVTAVEKDPQLAENLKNEFVSAVNTGQLTVVNKDIRDFNLNELPQNYKVVANIPYYLTSELIQHLLETGNQPEVIVLLVQKEVAQRITAADGKHSRLSIFVHAYGNPEIIRVVDRDNFQPSPDIDSAVLRISDISRKFFTDISAEGFFKLVRVGFQHKRKILTNNLADKYGTKDDVIQVITDCDLSEAARPELVNLTQWKCLYQLLT